VIVELTDEGKRLWDKVVAAQAEKESIVSTALDERERGQLNHYLRLLMNAFEAERGRLVKKGHDSKDE
jgi:DNA-binding MarR family transcriptional regulator